MKTKFYQIFTVASLFIVSISSTVAVSWGMNDLMFALGTSEQTPHIIILEKNTKNDLCDSSKLITKR